MVQLSKLQFLMRLALKTKGDNFFLALYRILVEKKTHVNLNCQGRAQFLPFLMEWTKAILRENCGVLTEATIYDAVLVSRYPCLSVPNVWRAFMEL